MRESTKAKVHAGLAVGHFACACYHFNRGGSRNWHFWFHAVVFSYDCLAVIEHSSREESIDEKFERFRLASPECSGLAELEVLEAS